MAMCHTARHKAAREDAMTTLLYTHEACLEHDPGSHHPESPDRLRAVLAGLSRPDFTRVKRREPPRADLDEVARVHPRPFIKAVLPAVPPPDPPPPDPAPAPPPRSAWAGRR